MSDSWQGKKVLVTGGSGFIGSHVVDRLVRLGAQVTATVFQDPVNLSNLDHVKDRIRMRVVDLTRLDDCMEICQDQDVVFNIAHADGSVAFKKNRPAYILRQNMLITLNMLEAASRNRVERFLVTSSAEVYPHDSPVPTLEAEGTIEALLPVMTLGVYAKAVTQEKRLFGLEAGTEMTLHRPDVLCVPRLVPSKSRLTT